MKSKYLLKRKKSKPRESLFDRVLNKIMIISFILFIAIVLITIIAVFWGWTGWWTAIE